MLGYVARFEPLAPETYRFRLQLVAGDQGATQERTVVDRVVERVEQADVEMAFVGHLVSSIVKPVQERRTS